MENTLIFASEKEVWFRKLLKFIIPTYLTSLFNTLYTIIDGIFVSAYSVCREKMWKNQGKAI